MLIRQPDGSSDALDYREKAPEAASRDMYLDDKGDPIAGLSVRGHLAAGTPGTVAGLAEAHRKYGRLPWAELVGPAVRLAQRGYAVSETEARRLSNFQEDFRAFNGPDCPFVRNNWQPGDKLVQTDLAATLERIQAQGAAGFYTGETARLLVAEMQSGGGLITAQDLAAYQPQWRRPLKGNYRGYTVISMPPSSSGGVALLQMLGMCNAYPLGEYGFQQAEAVHLAAEAARRAYADRATYLGDSDFYPAPLDSLIDAAYLRGRMASFHPQRATPSDSLGAGNFQLRMESFETTHTSIVDSEGMAVSVTTTLNSNFGCKVVVDGAGFFLNNEMDDFSIKPGVPNQFGLVGAEANAIAPGKRMLSSMTPTIVEKDGDLFMVLGSPGGSTIITSVMQVLMNVVDFGMPIDSAVWAPRFHHQWLPDEIMLEKGAIAPSERTALEGRGHRFREVNAIAVVKAIHRLPDGKLHAAGDYRNPDDDAGGY
jgi:gamma-glutamyltranspeptidase/glutathione hydrolase